jgi:ABC-type polysaccharide/polyol phosphate export permease
MNNLKNSLFLQIQYIYKFYFTWFNPAIHDLKIKYRKTILGPWWNVITNIIFLTILSLLWSKILNLPIRDYIGHVYIGLIIWIYLNEVINSSLSLLTDKYSNYYKNSFIPLLTLNLRNIFLNFIIFLHNLPLIIIFMILNSAEIRDYFLLFIGLVFLFINSFWLSIIVTFFGTRYLDVKALLIGLMTLGTLITPIMWKKEMLGKYSELIYLNPFAHFIDIIRDPVINNSLNIYLILTNFIFSVIGFLIVFILLKFKGHRIVFWI